MLISQLKNKNMEVFDKMKKIEVIFICGSFTSRQDLFVTFGNSHGILDQRKLSGFTKLGRISGKTLRGWLRHGLEKLLLLNDVSVCHPLPSNTIVNERNKKYYKEDLAVGYHPRGECKDQGGCPVYNMFGDLDKPSNLIVTPIYFYPSSGGGTSANNLNKITSAIGKGRIEIDHASPRKRSDTHQTYMSTETIVGSYIEAPWTLVIRKDDELHEVLIWKTLEFLFKKNEEWDFDFLIGGDRTAGCGQARAVIVNDGGKYLTKKCNEVGIPIDEVELLNGKFEKMVEMLKMTFPIKTPKEEKDAKKDENEG